MHAPFVPGQMSTTDIFLTHIALLRPNRSPETLILSLSAFFTHFFVAFEFSTLDKDTTVFTVLRFVFPHKKLTYLIKFIENTR